MLSLTIKGEVLENSLRMYGVQDWCVLNRSNYKIFHWIITTN